MFPSRALFCGLQRKKRKKKEKRQKRNKRREAVTFCFIFRPFLFFFAFIAVKREGTVEIDAKTTITKSKRGSWNF